MQALKLIAWIAGAVIVSFFVYMNFGEAVPVRFWPLDEGDTYVVDWPAAVIALFFFLLGFLPMWLLGKANSWRLNRRIESLKRAAESQRRLATPTPVPAPAAEPASTTATTPPAPKAPEPDAGPLTSDPA